MSGGTGALGRAVLLGAVAGMRSMAPLAAVSRRLSQGAVEAEGVAQRALARPQVARALTLAAAGELVADKMPFIPARIDPLPLAGRIVSGGLAAWAATSRARGSRAGAALVGACAAAATTFLAYHLRVSLDREGAPALLVALAEDVAMLEAASQGTAAL